MATYSCLRCAVRCVSYPPPRSACGGRGVRRASRPTSRVEAPYLRVLCLSVLMAEPMSAPMHEGDMTHEEHGNLWRGGIAFGVCSSLKVGGGDMGVRRLASEGGEGVSSLTRLRDEWGRCMLGTTLAYHPGVEGSLQAPYWSVRSACWLHGDSKPRPLMQAPASRCMSDQPVAINYPHHADAPVGLWLLQRTPSRSNTEGKGEGCVWCVCGGCVLDSAGINTTADAATTQTGQAPRCNTHKHHTTHHACAVALPVAGPPHTDPDNPLKAGVDLVH